MKFKPISQAPRDGTRVVGLCSFGCLYITWWYSTGNYWCLSNGADALTTHAVNNLVAFAKLPEVTDKVKRRYGI
jgi:hypothetical protein